MGCSASTSATADAPDQRTIKEFNPPKGPEPRAPLVVKQADPVTRDAVCKLALDCRCQLGESPIWDERTQRLFFVDINGKALHVFTPKPKQHLTVAMPEMIGCAVPTSDPNKLLVCLERDILMVDLTSDDPMKPIAQAPAKHGLPADGYRFNDGKVAPGGRLVVGRTNLKWREGKPGRLYALDHAKPGAGGRGALQSLTELLSPDEIHMPNGIAWDTSKMVLYLVDSNDRTVWAYRTDDDGLPLRPLDRRKVVTVPEDEGMPDGMCLDASGNLWVALSGGGCVACYDAKTGEVLHRYELPVQTPTSCVFGGADLRQLFVTSRAESGDDASPNAGGLFAVELPGIRGRSTQHYVDV